MSSISGFHLFSPCLLSEAPWWKHPGKLIIASPISCLFLVDIKMCFHFSILWDFKKAAKLVEIYHISHSVRTPYTTIIHSSQLMTNIDTVLLNSRIYVDFISFPLTWSRILSMEKAMAPHSSTLAWQIPWTEEPDRLQSMGSLRVGYDWATSLSLSTFMHWRRKWQPTPMFLPGESQGWGILVGYHLWGHTELDTTEVT